MNYYGLTPEFFGIYKKIEFISVFGGYDLPITHPISNGKVKKFYKLLCFVSSFWFLALNLYGIYEDRKAPLVALFDTATMGAVVTTASISYDFLWHREEFKEILLWVAHLYKKCKPSYGYLYKNAFVRSNKIIKITVAFEVVLYFVIQLLGLILQFLKVPVRTEDGEFNIKLSHPMHLPFIPVTGWISFLINLLQQHLAGLLIFNAYTLFIIVNFVVLTMFDAQLKTIEEYIERISDDIRLSKDDSCTIDLTSKIQKRFKSVIKTHIEFTNYVNKLVELTSRTFFTYKINAFVFSFFIYVAILDGNVNQFQAFGVTVAMSYNFWITYFCSAFESANQRLLEKVIDIPWYDLPPKHRPILIPFILKLQNPKLLQAKGLVGSEIICFEQFTDTFRTVCSWCLVVQKVLMK